MKTQSNQKFGKCSQQSAAAFIGEKPKAGELEVNVVFTDTQGTLAALKTAGELARELDAKIKLIHPLAVPYAYPLERPPVPVAFTEKSLLNLACQGEAEPLATVVNFYLCRNRLQTLLEVLQPRSLVVIGGKRRWWPTAESRLAKALRSQGHQVILAALK
jgi:hypothetical protein